MQLEVLMPALSAGMEEGKIARWLKEPGDSVVCGEVIAEVETDKAVTDLPAPADGTLHAILIRDGETVSINSAIAVLLVAADAEEAAAAVLGERTLASPLARQLAEKAGVDLREIEGSGPGGRVVRVDVERAHAASAPPVPAIEPEPEHALSRLIPNSTIRRTIARRLSQAKASIPHFYLQVDCEIDALLELRSELNSRPGVEKLSINDFVVKAAADALREVPDVNAAWSDEAIRVFERVDVAVAVSTDGGLVTPIIREADAKSLFDISREARQLAQRARQNRLRPDEYQGGGLTVSNLGMFAVQSFFAIINPPQSCILAAGAVTRRPVVRGATCVPAAVMSCTLSVDHRSVDGVLGARYLASFKRRLEEPRATFIQP
ncbi:MAG: 2-oxo acid dehydrogenase subunit E2 [Proteobacteria bacterium]|nr:2-oxo acid dehydrogenase subunit E2 [Pseudomonadota bacterium]